MRLQVDGHTVRSQHRVQTIGNLLADPLLNGEAPGELAHQSRQLGDPDDALVGDVADVGVPVERERMVLAERVELNRPFDHLAEAAVRAAAALGLEHRQQLGVTLVAGRRIEQRPHEAARGVHGGRRVELHPKRAEHLGRVLLEPAQLLVRYLATVEVHHFDGTTPHVYFIGCISQFHERHGQSLL